MILCTFKNIYRNVRKLQTPLPGVTPPKSLGSVLPVLPCVQGACALSQGTGFDFSLLKLQERGQVEPAVLHDTAV